MSPDCHMLIVLGLVLSQIVVSIAVRSDSGTAKVLLGSQRNVAVLPCGIKPYSAPVQRIYTELFSKMRSLLSSCSFTAVCFTP